MTTARTATMPAMIPVLLPLASSSVTSIIIALDVLCDCAATGSALGHAGKTVVTVVDLASVELGVPMVVGMTTVVVVVVVVEVDARLLNVSSTLPVETVGTVETVDTLETLALVAVLDNVQVATSAVALPLDGAGAGVTTLPRGVLLCVPAVQWFTVDVVVRWVGSTGAGVDGGGSVEGDGGGGLNVEGGAVDTSRVQSSDLSLHIFVASSVYFEQIVTALVTRCAHGPRPVKHCGHVKSGASVAVVASVVVRAVQRSVETTVACDGRGLGVGGSKPACCVVAPGGGGAGSGVALTSTHWKRA